MAENNRDSGGVTETDTPSNNPTVQNVLPQPPKETPSGHPDPLGDLLGTTATAKYQKRKLLGQGSFGSAWRVEETATGKLYAAKVMDTNNMSPKDRGFVTNEVKCLVRCSQPNIVQHIGNWDINGMLLIVMEFADGGDLYRQIKARQPQMRYFREHEILFIFLQLCLALDHIHEKKMMHRDIKTANVLLTTTGIVKLGDFGFSRQYEDSLSKPVGSTFCGTPYYLSPELWRRAPYSKKTEMWALGVVLYEVIALRRPFGGRNMDELIDNICHGRRGSLPDQYSSDLAQVTQKLLTVDPKQRPSLRALFREPYIRSGLQTLRRSVENHSKIPEEIRTAIAQNVEEVLSSDLKDYDSSKVVSRKGILKCHLADAGWQDCELSLQPDGATITEQGEPRRSETIDLSAITSICPIDPSVANEHYVFAMKTQTGKAYWFKEKDQTNFQDWVTALQNAIPF